MRRCGESARKSCQWAWRRRGPACARLVRARRRQRARQSAHQRKRAQANEGVESNQRRVAPASVSSAYPSTTNAEMGTHLLLYRLPSSSESDAGPVRDADDARELVFDAIDPRLLLVGAFTVEPNALMTPNERGVPADGRPRPAAAELTPLTGLVP